jgi:hypothetical protein
MPVAQLESRLARMEGLLAIMARELEAAADKRDLDTEVRPAYRRGYLAGHAAHRRGVERTADEALPVARGPRAARKAAR